jgi:hypothetical protein
LRDLAESTRADNEIGGPRIAHPADIAHPAARAEVAAIPAL